MAPRSSSGLEQNLLEDTTEREERSKQQFEREVQGVIHTYRSAMAQTDVFTDLDIQTYERDSFNDALWNRHGQSSYEERVRVVRETRSTHLPKEISEAVRLERAFREGLEKAVTAKGISRTSALKWEQRLKDPSVHHWEKTAFLRDKAPDYMKRWIELGEDMQKIESEVKLLKLTSKDIPELATIQNSAFLDAHYDKKRSVLDKILGFIAAAKKDKTRKPDEMKMKELFELAEQQLDYAVSIGALAEKKKGTWLRRIFQSSASAKKIEAFLKGNDVTSLKKLIANWADARKRFDAIEEKREKVGTPASFHFVHVDVFLNWHFEKRKAYLQEAKNRFEDIEKERPDFLVIRHELDAKNWEEAEELMEAAKKQPLSIEDSEKLRSMEKFLREHRGVKMENKETNETPQELVDSLNGIMSELPQSSRKMHVATCKRGKGASWVLKVLWYNRVWCHQHHYLDEEKELEYQEQAKDLTPQRIKHGHQKTGLEVNDLTGQNNQEPAIRDQERVRAPQILITGENSDADMLARNMANNERCYNFWYWTSIIDKNVSFKEHQHVVFDIHPRMMRIMRQLDTMGCSLTSENGILKLAN